MAVDMLFGRVLLRILYGFVLISKDKTEELIVLLLTYFMPHSFVDKLHLFISKLLSAFFLYYALEVSVNQGLEFLVKIGSAQRT